MSEEQNLVPDDNEAEELAFAQGVAEVRGTPIPEPVEKPVVESVAEEGEPEVAAEQAAPEGQPEEATKTPTLEERLAAIESNFPSIKQGLDSLAGRIGGINRDLQGLKTLREQKPQDTAAAAAQTKIVAEKLKRLNADYPEVAAALADDLNEIMSAPRETAAPQFDIEDIAKRAEERATMVVERRMLEREHPKWEQDIALKDEMGRPLRDPSGKYLPSPVFLEWLQQKPETFRQAFVGGLDSDFVSSGLKDFKEFRANRLGQGTPKPAPQSSPAPAAPAPASKQARLAAAVTPQKSSAVVGTAAISEDDAFVAGWKSVRG